jgi:aryl-alcohol dehydrogenase-like predicted oxidoreductase
VALAWLMRRPGVTAPIIGASKPHHIADAAAAVALTLSPQDCAFLEEPYQPRPVAGWLT